MYHTEQIVVEVTEIVKNWVIALDSLLGDYSEDAAFRLYNQSEDTLFFENLSEEDVYLINDYLDVLYRRPLTEYITSMGYDIVRVIKVHVHSDPTGKLVVNLLLNVRAIHDQLEIGLENEH